MIGRGLLGNPFLVKQIVDYLEHGKYNRDISYTERKKYILKHLDKLIELKGEHIASLEMRGHGAWYLKGLKGSSKIKNLIVNSKDTAEFRAIIEGYFDTLEIEKELVEIN